MACPNRSQQTSLNKYWWCACPILVACLPLQPFNTAFVSIQFASVGAPQLCQRRPGHKDKQTIKKCHLAPSCSATVAVWWSLQARRIASGCAYFTVIFGCAAWHARAAIRTKTVGTLLHSLRSMCAIPCKPYDIVSHSGLCVAVQYAHPAAW